MIQETTLPTFSELNATARIWVFQSSKLLSEEWQALISQQLNQFLQSWAAHGKDLFASFEIRHNRFIIVAVDEAIAGATGCSIDKMMQEVQRIDLRFNLNLLDRMKVAYLDNGEVKEVSTKEFSALHQSGAVNQETIVFDNTVQSIEGLNTMWERPVKDTWVTNLL